MAVRKPSSEAGVRNLKAEVERLRGHVDQLMREGIAARAEGEPTHEQLARDADAVSIQRDDLREHLDRIRAAAESDPDLPTALRDFLLHETESGWLHVTDAMVERLRTTGSHHEGTGDRFGRAYGPKIACPECAPERDITPDMKAF